MSYGIFDILTLIGSLGLFLYGMKVMSDALLKLAGDRMRSILSSATSNRILAVMTGFAITAVIQSSSATTLMVVSFANASLLTLTESVGIIMGANIGTTVTAWLISILGFKVSMSAIALPLVGLGFLLSMSSKAKYSDWGRFIIGFSLLFIGLQFLKDSVPDLNNHPETFAFLSAYADKGFLSILLFLGIGALLTVVIQSSSAAMALTLIMCFEGWVPFDMAAAMVLGQNLGTTITANIAAIVANYQAKRTARAHLIFNLVGVLVTLVVLTPFLKVIDAAMLHLEGASPFTQTAAIPIALSLFHTLFNVLNTLLLIGFVAQISRMASWMVPATPVKEINIEQARFLDDVSLRYPQTAVKALMDESQRLYETSTFKVLTHGLHVHREEVESDEDLDEIVGHMDLIEINIDQIYQDKIKNIYGQIVAYATTIQKQFHLEEDTIILIRELLRADRLVVEVVKDIKPLHVNLTQYIPSENEYIRKEYNRLRRLILRVVRLLQQARQGADRQEHLDRCMQLLERIDKHDVLINGTIDKLVRDKLITNEMATSLMNDSSLAIEISRKLVQVSLLLYFQELEENEPEESPELQTDGDSLP